MKRLFLAAAGLPAALILAALAIFLLAAPARGPHSALASAPPPPPSGNGPAIVAGPPSLVSGMVRIPVSTSAVTFDPYVGFNIAMKWDGTVFAYSSVDMAGSILNAFTPFCPPPDSTTFVTPSNSGVNFGCTALAPPLGPPSGLTTTGLLATVVLTPLTTGCSAIHLTTLTEGQNNASRSTFTINGGANANPQIPQAPGYTDTTSDQAGNTCAAVPLPTATPYTATAIASPTSTITPTPSVTPTFVPTAISTAQYVPAGGFRTVTPSSTPPTPGTATPPATATPAPGGAPPGGAAPPVGLAPGGGAAPGNTGPQGLITPPNTGTGAATGSVAAATLLLAAAALLLVGSGALFAWWRRERSR
ncbi:MAG: hypothetical protein ACYDEB_14675 [Dehalococcoidia bacterium]